MNLVKDENGGMLANSCSIHSREKNYLCQLLNVHWVTLLETVPQHSHQIIPITCRYFFKCIFI